MTKEEFLKELESKLQGLPREDIDEKINFFNEMICDKMDDGKTEEEAVAEIGDIDDVVYVIAKDVPLVKLVKERFKPKRRVSALEIILLILGFPLWFPLLIVGLVLIFVFWLLVWLLAIITYAVEIGLIGYAIVGVIAFVAKLVHGSFDVTILGATMLASGGAILLFFALKPVFKLCLKISVKILTSIKSGFIRRGE